MAVCGQSLAPAVPRTLALNENSPDHSSLTRISQRLPIDVYRRVFTFVLDLVDAQGLLNGTTVAVDSTLLEANAAMKSIVRKETGEDWDEYLTQLMREEGLLDEDEQPTSEERRRFDKQRAKSGKKKVSNKEWESPTDADARIVKMKDGRTRLGYKAEHVIDLDTEVLLSAEVHHGTESDTATLLDAVVDAQRNIIEADSEAEIEEVAADKGYHANDVITECDQFGVRTYIPEPDSPHNRKWTDKPEEVKTAVLNNRRRTRRKKGRKLQRERSEKVERSFAHICETGGARRCWLRGLEKINQRYLLNAAAHNLSQVMRKLFKIGSPRALQGGLAALCAMHSAVTRCWSVLMANHRDPTTIPASPERLLPPRPTTSDNFHTPQNPAFSTGC